MKSELLGFLDDLVSETRMKAINENQVYENDLSESFKCENEKKIRLCDDVLRHIEIELFDNYLSSLKSHTIVLDKKYKNKEEFIEDYKNNEYFYDMDSYHNGDYINKKELEYNKTDIIRFFDDNLGCLIFDCKKLEFIDDIRNK